MILFRTNMYGCKFIWILILTSRIARSLACKGCVELDEYNFDKLIKVFPTVLVKFDIAFPFGDIHETYEKFSKEVSKSQDLLIAQVGVKDYGDRDNENIANKYKIKKEDFPTILLFKDGQLDEPIKFSRSEGYTLENLKRFVKINSKVYLGAPGCIEQYDKLATRFLSEKNERPAIKQEAELLLKDQNSENIQFAKNYIKIMDKVISIGEDFVENEQKRIQSLIQGKLSQNKKEQLLLKMNILDSFAKSSTRDEL